MPHTDHLIQSYDDELTRLADEIIRMGELALAQFQAAMDAVTHRDTDTARQIIADDDAIDTIELAIGHDVVRLLALRAPMARDLREVFAALRIASDIERIGDYAGNIAGRVHGLSNAAPSPFTVHLHQLAVLAADAVREVLAAYRVLDAECARQVWLADDKLDQAYTSICHDLLTAMVDNPDLITSGTDMLFIAKHIERIGDHATNIAENIWFAVHGEPLTNH